jgi:hypothetical protein
MVASILSAPDLRSQGSSLCPERGGGSRGFVVSVGPNAKRRVVAVGEGREEHVKLKIPRAFTLTKWPLPEETRLSGEAPVWLRIYRLEDQERYRHDVFFNCDGLLRTLRP